MASEDLEGKTTHFYWFLHPYKSFLAHDFEKLAPKDICGRRYVGQARIVGGETALYGEWPWQVCMYTMIHNQYSHMKVSLNDF